MRPNLPRKRKKNSKQNQVNRKTAAQEKDYKLTKEQIAAINESPLPPLTPSEDIVALAELLTRMTPVLLQMLIRHVGDQSMYYNKFEFLKMCGICPNTCKKWIGKGLPYIPMDNITLFRKSDVDDFFNRFRKVITVVISCIPGFVQGTESIAACAGV